MENWENLTEEKCIQIQNDLRQHIYTIDNFNIKDIHAIAGIDIAYWKDNDTERAVCCIVVIDIDTHEIVERQHKFGVVTFPYIPGCLAFRELPLILETIKQLKVDPDLYMVDGNGLIHPRKMGSATHLGILINKPTIGVAKTYYKINNTDFDMPDNQAGASTDIFVNNCLAGKALRTHKDVKPVFISVGNNIDIDTAVDIVMRTTGKESHIPIPTRLADIDTHLRRKEYKQSNTVV